VKLLYTEQALDSLQECLDFLSAGVPPGKIQEIRDRIIAKADKLLESPFTGQRDEYLAHLGLEHRRIIEGNYKIIYRVTGEIIYITDIFDTRQDPSEMKP
jgi:toxin ParE1/3/4